jgi:predicted enzyme related to lactoylglutathione lyase
MRLAVNLARSRTIVIATALVAACAGRTTSVATPVPGPNIKPGKFVWHDLVTDDLTAARRFYGALLGWQFEDIERLGKPYVVARFGSRRVGGLVAVPSRQDQELSQWVSYVSVPDVKQTVSDVEKAGGRTLVGPVDVQGIAQAAVVVEPQGAVMGFARILRGDPEDEPAPIEGTFFWNEYLARDAGAAVSFFSDLLGYQSAITDRLGMAEYHVLRRDRARGGVLTAPEHVSPQWLPYILVADPAAVAARAQSLGGRIIVAPRPDLRKGTLAIIADPSGGAVALQKWPI